MSKIPEISSFDADASTKEPEPPIIPPHASTSVQDMLRSLNNRGSSARALVQKFEEIEKQAALPPKSIPTFTDVVSENGRGVGMEETSRQIYHNDAGSDYDGAGGMTAGNRAATDEEKQKRAFIPKTLFSSKKKILEERVEASKKWSGPDNMGAEGEDEEVEDGKRPAVRFPLRPGGYQASEDPGAASDGAEGEVTLDQFQQRIAQKSQSNLGGNSLGETTGNEGAIKPLPGHLPASSYENSQLHSFEERILSKSNVSITRVPTKGLEDEGPRARTTAAHPPTRPDNKRDLIRKVMQDESLSPQERNQRVAAIMRGEYNTTAKSVVSEEDTTGGSEDWQTLDMSEGSDRRSMSRGRSTAGGDSYTTNSNWEEFDMNNLGENSTHAASTYMSTGLDDETQWMSTGNSIGTRLTTGDIVPEPQDLATEPRHTGGGGGLGYGSLPMPEEHFPSDARNNNNGAVSTSAYPPLEQLEEDQDTAAEARNSRPIANTTSSAYPTLEQLEAEDDAAGLAVATAVAQEDDEPDYVYNAVEFDPWAKPPLYRNRRFRSYTCFALILIAVMVALVVVKITSESKQDEIINKNELYEKQPSLSPTKSPITDREASGIIEQLEGGILYLRNERFVDMDRYDPRLLALDWILHKDDQQLVSDDVNLYQRYALAVLAYAMDSRAWYACGDPGDDYNVEDCFIPVDENTTLKYGMWLSSSSECTWYGVVCSGDGVVRAVDLNYNDLIGELPYELYALAFIQKLALSHNCIYGTIPSEMGRMHNLLSLELHGNGLSGELPEEIYDLDKLQLLNLAEQWGQGRECNRTDGRTVDIDYQRGGLERPLVENAGLTGTLAEKVGVWRSMKGLYLNKNSFEGSITPGVGNMRYLRFLWLHDNFIAGSIPDTITKLKNLRHLRLGENFLISTLPSELGRMSDLERLEVNSNSMMGEIPNGIYKLTDLQVVRLDDSLMSEAPWLVVPDEGFTGSISTLIGGLQDLQWLLLSNNPMSGTIPTELGLCENLSVLRVHRTDIEGSMPQEICMLRDKFLNSDYGGTGVLYSDCRPNNRTGDPFLECDCCSDCCDHTTGVCIADD